MYPDVCSIYSVQRPDAFHIKTTFKSPNRIMKKIILSTVLTLSCLSGLKAQDDAQSNLNAVIHLVPFGYNKDVFYGGKSQTFSFNFGGSFRWKKLEVSGEALISYKMSDKARASYPQAFRDVAETPSLQNSFTSIGLIVRERQAETRKSLISIHAGIQEVARYLKKYDLYDYAYTPDSAVIAHYYQDVVNVTLGVKFEWQKLQKNETYSRHLLFVQPLVGVHQATHAYYAENGTYHFQTGSDFKGSPFGMLLQYKWYKPLGKKWGLYAGYNVELLPYAKLPETDVDIFRNRGGTRLPLLQQFSIGIHVMDSYHLF
jgi:hypothetical protein